mmetsp:Transcript_14427/g.39414  ORF Transcript_14427/g.39414 Transcript_14427/m.39414 type:complete len:228 (+) Transcript_14427:1645-2328(+)
MAPASVIRDGPGLCVQTPAREQCPLRVPTSVFVRMAIVHVSPALPETIVLWNVMGALTIRARIMVSVNRTESASATLDFANLNARVSVLGARQMNAVVEECVTMFVLATVVKAIVAAIARWTVLAQFPVTLMGLRCYFVSALVMENAILPRTVFAMKVGVGGCVKSALLTGPGFMLLVLLADSFYAFSPACWSGTEELLQSATRGSANEQPESVCNQSSSSKRKRIR